MLNALSSASAGQAIIITGTDASFLDLSHGTSQHLAPEIARLILAGEDDLRAVSVKDKEAFENSLRLEWSADRSTRMLQILLDTEEEIATRHEAFEALESLLDQGNLFRRILFTTFSLPLSLYQHLPREFEEWRGGDKAKELITVIRQHQDQISQIRETWNCLADDLFDGETSRRGFELAAIERGAFYELALVLHGELDVDAALFDCYVKLKDQQNSRAIINAWTNEIKSFRKKKVLATAAEQISDADVPEHFPKDSRTTYQKYINVSEQQNAVIAALSNGNLVGARRFMNQLIATQLQEKSPEFAVKSLCKMAQEAKERGQHSLQLEWLERALEISPGDGWANGQAGDGYLDVFRYSDAQSCFDRASQFGQAAFAAGGHARLLSARGQYEAAAKAFINAIEEFGEIPGAENLWSGYCETLRKLWKFEDAHTAYDVATKKFPDDFQLWLGFARAKGDLGLIREAYKLLEKIIANFPSKPQPRASLIRICRSSGDFNKALSLADRAIQEFPNNVYLVGARARVLSDAGRHGEAIEAYKDAIDRFPNDSNSWRSYAETQLNAGNRNEALRVATEALEHFPEDVRVRTTYADILTRNGKFAEALQQFEKNVKDFPLDAYSLNGRANLLKRLGHYGRALEAYEEITKRLPNYDHAKIGIASVHVILKKFDEAMKYLPREGATSQASWYGAHVKGMLLLKQYKAVEAKRLFENGLRTIPFFREKKLFELGLAAANIQLKNYSEVVLSTDSREPIRTLLFAHALFAMGNFDEATAVFNYANDNLPPPLASLRDAIGAKFRALKNKDAARSEQWIWDREQDAILQAA